MAIETDIVIEKDTSVQVCRSSWHRILGTHACSSHPYMAPLPSFGSAIASGVAVLPKDLLWFVSSVLIGDHAVQLAEEGGVVPVLEDIAVAASENGIVHLHRSSFLTL